MFYTCVSNLQKQLQNWIRKKMAFVSVFTVFLRGVRVVGGVTIYIYTYIYIHSKAYSAPI